MLDELRPQPSRQFLMDRRREGCETVAPGMYHYLPLAKALILASAVLLEIRILLRNLSVE